MRSSSLSDVDSGILIPRRWSWSITRWLNSGGHARVAEEKNEVHCPWTCVQQIVSVSAVIYVILHLKYPLPPKRTRLQPLLNIWSGSMRANNSNTSLKSEQSRLKWNIFQFQVSNWHPSSGSTVQHCKSQAGPSLTVSTHASAFTSPSLWMDSKFHVSVQTRPKCQFK